MLGLVAVALFASVLPMTAAPATAPSEDDGSIVMELARRYAPYVMVQRQPEPCGSGEPYAPSDVGAILGQSDVVLRDASGEILMTAPTESDLATAPSDSNIDLPGDAGNPGCDFERRFGRASSSLPPTMYVRIATDPDRPDQIALQYWLYFVFNDWNNIHEGDWEMAQVVFDVTSPEAALHTEPAGMAVSQHDGNERRPWNEVTRQGERPLIFIGVGSHAIYYSSHRWFGKSGATGFGCDDTRGPSDQLDSNLVVMPETISPDDEFGWITFAGRWGQREPSLNDSETGPPTSEQWIHPITWMESKGRQAAITVPELGGVTGFFCAASTAGSRLLNDLLDSPLLIGSILAVLVAGVVLLIKRTRWSPVFAEPVASRRSVGQTIRSSWRFVIDHKRMFLPICVLVLAGGVLASLVQFLVTRLSAPDALFDVIGRSSAASGAVAFLIGSAVTVPVVIVALGSAMVVVNRLDVNGPDTRRPGRSAITNVWRSGVLLPLAVLALVVLVGWIVLPLALFLIASWSVAPAAALRDGSPLDDSLKASTQLTRGLRIRTLLTAFVAITFEVLAGLFIGTIVLILFNVSFGFVNLIAGAITAVLTPWLGVMIVMYHADLAARPSEFVESPHDNPVPLPT